MTVITGHTKNGIKALRIPNFSVQLLADLRDESRGVVMDNVLQELNLPSNGIGAGRGVTAEPNFAAIMKMIKPKIGAQNAAETTKQNTSYIIFWCAYCGDYSCSINSF